MHFILDVKTPSEVPEDVIRAHVAWVQDLAASGSVLWSGPYGDGSGGLLILAADGPDEAGAIAAGDPFLRAGVASHGLKVWEPDGWPGALIAQFLRSRKSIRVFRDQPVPDETLLRLAEAGQWAPSPWNLQLRRFVIVRDRARLAALQAACYGQKPLRTAAAAIVVCVAPVPEGLSEQERKFDPAADGYLATQNILLAAHALGLGAVPMGGFVEADVRWVCAIPADFRVVSVIPVGHPAEDPAPKPRPPIVAVTRFEHYSVPNE